MYTQLAREGVVVIQDGDTELSLIYFPAGEPDSVSYGAKLRVTAQGDSCRKLSGQIAPLHLIHESLTNTYIEPPDIRWILTVVFMRITNIPIAVSGVATPEKKYN